MTIDLTHTRRTVSSLIQSVALDDRVIKALLVGDQFLPKECELWDYKRQSGADSLAVAKVVRYVVSFYNTFGGYLIYGVDETERDQHFVPCGIEPGAVSLATLKSQLATYTGDAIDISYREIEVAIGGTTRLLGVLHIPKRPRTAEPATFGKNGPEERPGTPLFRRNTTYIRRLDRCVAAETKADWQMLLGPRVNPLERTDELDPIKSEWIAPNNLPDRNFICSRFIGRASEIEVLWRWLGDPLSHTRVLAGEGGKGKTSIAYAFSEEVSRVRPYGLNQVIWLTAKQRQFSALVDSYVDVPETHFRDTHELLRVLCQQLAILETEIDDASDDLLKKHLTKALRTLPCFIVIDDVDSISELDEQRKILEMASEITSSSGSRFLLTTRMNLTYSQDVCITVSGLKGEEYRLYVDYLTEAHSVKIDSPSRTRLEEVSGGSPLFTESIVRLVKTGLSPKQALTQWQGKLGEEVRMAALLREIGKLSPEAQRVLLACSLLGEGSLAELKQVTSYDDVRMTRCIAELQALFFLAAPKLIKKEPRFRVPSTTAMLVLEKRQDLAVKPAALEKAVAKLRMAPKKGLKKGYREIGVAISQAIALLRTGRYEDAIATIDAALSSRPDDPDLLLTQGHCFLEQACAANDGRFNMKARGLFKRSYDLGQRKELLFLLWFRSEAVAEHASGMVDVATLAVDDGIGSVLEWLVRRSQSLWRLYEVQRKASNFAQAQELLRDCWRTLERALKRSDECDVSLRQFLTQLSDERWDVAVRDAVDVASWRNAFDVAKESLRADDLRVPNFDRLLTALEAILAKYGSDIGQGGINLMGQLLREARNSFSDVRFLPTKDRERLELRLKRLNTSIAGLEIST